MILLLKESIMEIILVEDKRDVLILIKLNRLYEKDILTFVSLFGYFSCKVVKQEIYDLIKVHLVDTLFKKNRLIMIHNTNTSLSANPLFS